MKQFLISLGLYFVLLPNVLAQTSNWKIDGNNLNSGDFIGSTNNESLLFKTNNVAYFNISPTGIYRFHGLSGNGNGMLLLNNTGEAFRLGFTGVSTDLLTAAGTFAGVSGLTGWNYSGNNILSANTGFVGIGTVTPTEKLDVTGNARITGTLTAGGLNIVQTLHADTIKGVDAIEVANNFCMEGGHDVFTMSGDIKIQSKPGNNFNTILNDGTTGNVGIGTSNPQFKLDVNGDLSSSSKIVTPLLQVERILPFPGDSVIHIGDSSLIINGNTNTIYASSNSGIKGLGLGSACTGIGLNSVAIGRRVFTNANADYAIIIGAASPTGNAFRNSIPNSLMVGFNSDLPSFFVGSAAGDGTTGNVGIGTSQPEARLQVGEGMQKIVFDGIPNNGPDFFTSFMGMNVSRNSSGVWSTSALSGNSGAFALVGDISGSVRFVTVKSTGTGPQTFTDGDVNSKTSMRLTADGRLQIGPDALIAGGQFDQLNTRLTVDGRILAKEVIVSIVDWPDYVFEKSYKLRSIEETQAFILKNGHLPGIKPATAMQEGVLLGETSKVQMEKIEELTLYIIQLNERMKKLEKENELLKSRMETNKH